MKILQSPLFARTVKKFHKNQKSVLDEVIKKILIDPQIGVEKKGDLKGIYVHKFKINNTLYLLSYRIEHDTLELITIGPHENYYRNLKSYTRNK
ncbi:MAG: type II toxin-antitoxin system RelE/ParE family toxin [Candidatus Latescibacteria bacterium]|nr:type II toxin-antitoxin system RelE/ParE family toxin [Candidatus Latescibacterota bacterium]